MELTKHKPAPFSARFTAMTIDLMIIACLQILLGSSVILLYGLFCNLLGIESLEKTEEILSQFCGIFLFIGYFTMSVGLFGNTAGKYVTNIQIISEKTLSPLSPMQAFQRSLGYILSSWTYAIGFVMAYFRQDKKALHDLVCQTIVVDKRVAASTAQLILPLDYDDSGVNSAMGKTG